MGVSGAGRHVVVWSPYRALVPLFRGRIVSRFAMTAVVVLDLDMSSWVAHRFERIALLWILPYAADRGAQHAVMTAQVVTPLTAVRRSARLPLPPTSCAP
jgi:hypothetical protein